MKTWIRNIFRRAAEKIYPELKMLTDESVSWNAVSSYSENLTASGSAKIKPPYQISNSSVGDYTYVSERSVISHTTIGAFCSIGPNFLCGWGIHPTNGISTHPMFYSTLKQNGMTLSPDDKIEERQPIVIGSDVFIGMNVTVLDGVTIGNGAVIGAGCVVSKSVPEYAIAVGNPMRIARYRFDDRQLAALKSIRWWENPKIDLQDIERYFFDVDRFIAKYAPAEIQNGIEQQSQ